MDTALARLTEAPDAWEFAVSHQLAVNAAADRVRVMVRLAAPVVLSPESDLAVRHGLDVLGAFEGFALVESPIAGLCELAGDPAVLFVSVPLQPRRPVPPQ